MGQISDKAENNLVFKEMLKEADDKSGFESPEHRYRFIENKLEGLKKAQDPIKILANKILVTDSTLIMNEATKALKVFSQREDVIHQLWKEKLLLEILRKKF